MSRRRPSAVSPHHARAYIPERSIRRPLTLALRLALAGPMLAGNWWSATVQAQASDTMPATEQNRSAGEGSHRYDIAAGPLSTVLTQFSAEAGILLVGATDLAQGKNSPGVRGTFRAQAALDALLAGTGLEAVRNAQGQYVLQAAGNESRTLAPVRVEDNIIPASNDPGRTEGSGSYTTSAMSTATKLPLSIRETPQSVTVITRERMDDQSLITASDLVQNTPGITITATAPYRETFFARGYAVETYLFDGLPVTTNSSRRGTFLNDLAMYDRVEIVRGAAGLTQGSGTPSAALNFVRKRPTNEFQASVQGQVGRWNHIGVDADVSGPLSQSGGLRGRAVARWQDSDSFMDVVTEDRQLIYLIGEADIARDTLLTLSLSHQENDNATSYGGLPTAKDGSDLGLPRSTYLGNTWNYWDDTTTSALASLEHRFGNDWKLNFSINQIWGDQEQSRAGVTLNEADQWDQVGGWASLSNDRTSYDLHIQGPFDLFGRKHELIVGASQRVAKDGNDTAGYWPGYTYATDIDIYNWQHNAPMPEFEVDYYFRSREEQHGAYSTARLNLAEPLKLIVGLRLDWFDFKSTDDIWEWDDVTETRTGWVRFSNAYDYDRHLGKYAGLVYDEQTVFGLRQLHRHLQGAEQPNGCQRIRKPVVGENYEAGVRPNIWTVRSTSAPPCSGSTRRIARWKSALAVQRDHDLLEPAGMVRSGGYDLEIQGR